MGNNISPTLKFLFTGKKRLALFIALLAGFDRFLHLRLGARSNRLKGFLMLLSMLESILIYFPSL